MLKLDRELSRRAASGAPVFARLAYDDRHLYVAMNVAMFDVTKLRKGSAWGQDDGAEIDGGQSPAAKPVPSSFADSPTACCGASPTRAPPRRPSLAWRAPSNSPPSRRHGKGRLARRVGHPLGCARPQARAGLEDRFQPRRLLQRIRRMALLGRDACRKRTPGSGRLFAVPLRETMSHE